MKAATTTSRLPIVDALVHARPAVPRHAATRPRGEGLVTAATIYAAALIATAGFVIASVVDYVLGVDRQGRPREP